MEPLLYDGLWSTPCLEFPDHLAYMMIDAKRQRLIVFTPNQIDPVTSLPARFLPAFLWYRQEQGGIFPTRHKLSDEEYLNFYRFDGDTFVLLKRGQEYPWAFVPPEKAPLWLAEYVERIYAKMDLREKEHGAGPVSE